MDRKKLMRFYVVLMLVAIGVGGWYTIDRELVIGYIERLL